MSMEELAWNSVSKPVDFKKLTNDAFDAGFRAGLEAAANYTEIQQGIVTEFDIVVRFPKNFKQLACEIRAIEVPE